MGQSKPAGPEEVEQDAPPQSPSQSSENLWRSGPSFSAETPSEMPQAQQSQPPQNGKKLPASTLSKGADLELLGTVKETLEQVSEELHRVYADQETPEMGLEGVADGLKEEESVEQKKLEESCLLLYDQPAVVEDPVVIAEEVSSSRRALFSPTRQLALETRRHKKDAAALMRWVIFPNNKFILVWDGLILTLVLYVILYLPFEMGITGGFHASERWSYYFLIETIINMIFLTDVGLNFCRAYYDKYGRLVVNRSKIAKRYLRGYFLVDLVACTPVDLILFLVPEADGRVNPFQLLVAFNLFRLFRISRAFRVLKNSSFLLRLRLSVHEVYFSILSAFGAVFVFVHWTGCLMSFVVLCETGSFFEEDLLDPNKPNWMQRYSQNNVDPEGNAVIDIFGYDWGNVFNRYILALYWAVTTTTSIGYGDIVPATSAELWVQTSLMLLSGFVWAMLLAKSIEIMEILGSRRRNYRAKLREMNNLISSFKIDEDSVSYELFPEKHYSSYGSSIATHARLYIHRQHKSILGVPVGVRLKEVSPVLATLPVGLRNRLCLGLIHRYLVRLDMFRHPDVSLSTLAGVASLCKVVHHDAGNSILIGSDTSPTGLYILVGGIVSVKESSTKSFERQFKVYCSAGVIGRDTVTLPKRSPLRPNVHISILTHSEMIYVPREALFALFRIHPQVWKDYGRWYKMKAILKAWGRAQARGLNKMTSPDEAYTSFESFVRAFQYQNRATSD